MSDDSDSSAMGEESHFDLRDLERVVVVGMDSRGDWDNDEDRAYSPRTAGVRDFLLSGGEAFLPV